MLHAKILFEALSEPSSDVSEQRPTLTGNMQLDEYEGMASIRFPYFTTDGALEEGRRCHGCEFRCKFFQSSTFPALLLDGFTPPGGDHLGRLRAAQYRLLPQAELIGHKLECAGCKILG